MKEHELKKEIRLTEERMLEDDKEWYESFRHAHFSGGKNMKHKNRRTFWVAFGSSAISVAATILLCFLIIPPLLDKPDDTERHYTSDGLTSATSSLDEVNSNIDGFSVALNEIYLGDIYRAYDRPTGDTLYYSFDIYDYETTYEKITINIYTNPYYVPPKKLDAAPTEATVAGFELKYNYFYVEDEGIFTLSYIAETSCNGIIICIEYEQYALDETTNFFNFFEETFILD